MFACPVAKAVCDPLSAAVLMSGHRHRMPAPMQECGNNQQLVMLVVVETPAGMSASVPHEDQCVNHANRLFSAPRYDRHTADGLVTRMCFPRRV